MMDYERKELGTVRETSDKYENFALTTIVACHSLMQNKARNNFQVTVLFLDRASEQSDFPS